MKKGISFLQIGVFIACGVGIILAVLIFSDKLPIGKKSSSTVAGSVTIWGTLPYGAMKTAIETMAKSYPDVRVEYSEKKPATFQSDFVNALASGVGPDLITLNPSDVIVNRDRLLAVPYQSLPQAAYLSTFIDQSAQFLMPDGVVAFPIVVDPMVMYYNRDMLTSAFALNPPATWDDVIALGKSVTKHDDAGDLNVETVALGTFNNITHAKELLLTLIFQTGNKLIAWDAEQKKYVSTFSDPDQTGNSGVSGALRFYTGFANSGQSDVYSWNAGLPNDRDQFVAGKLAIYFGNASELLAMRTRNPNLNFDIAMMPQRSATSTKVAYGAMTGISVVKFSKNIPVALIVAQELVKTPAITAYLSATPGFAPARRDMLGAQNDDARMTLIFRSAIISQSFLDPDPAQTTALFKKSVGDINAGTANPDSILSTGNSLLSSILEKVQPKPAPAQ